MADVAAAAAGTGGVVAVLLASGVGGGAVSRVVAALTDRIVQRLLELAARDVGPAPAPFAWLAFGSHGRQEQTLHTDQDTGLLLAEDADAATRDWGAALGARMTDWLAACGFPRCAGGVMASEPDWRRDVAGWQARFQHWLAAPAEEALLGAEIAFDVRTVAGDLDAEALLRPVIRGAARAPLFLAHLARQVTRHRPPLGFLGRFTVERSGEHAGTFDVKAGAMLPIADLARLHVLARGGTERSTDERLAAAAAHGQVSGDLSETLRAGYQLALRIRLEGQLERRREGEPMGNRVDPGTLPPFERSHLKETFRAIRLAQEAVATAYRTAQLG